MEKSWGGKRGRYTFKSRRRRISKRVVNTARRLEEKRELVLCHRFLPMKHAFTYRKSVKVRETVLGKTEENTFVRAI